MIRPFSAVVGVVNSWCLRQICFMVVIFLRYLQISRFSRSIRKAYPIKSHVLVGRLLCTSGYQYDNRGDA